MTRSLRQVGCLLAGYLLFVMAMGSLHPSAVAALSNAHGVDAAQSAVGVDYVEQLLRGMSFGAAGSPLYVGLHFAVTPLVMLWLIVARPAVWARSRWWLVGIAVVAVVLFAVLPVAPPWMLGAPDGTPWAHPAAATAGIDTLAAFPSLHVALAVWVAMSLRSCGARRWVFVYPAFVALVVVVTGNHYLLDVAGGWLLAAAVGRTVSLFAARGGEFKWLQTLQRSPL